ncbi:MAG: T9SS type A sorting domain-containing protein [Bacteroidota bacterium]
MKLSTPIALLAASALLLLLIPVHQTPAPVPAKARYAVHKSLEVEDEEYFNDGREEYFNELLRNPVTGVIPSDARTSELSHAKDVNVKAKSLNSGFFNWEEVGPNKVGGRTRALAIDLSDNTGNTLIAGGVSGGIWKTTDGGTSWEKKTQTDQSLSVSYIAQNPLTPSTWYYSSGEFDGNSASSRGGGGIYRGSGLWKSTDNGETWNPLLLDDPDILNGSFDSPFDYISKVMVSPTTGNVFITTNGFGVFKSTDGDTFEQKIFGGDGEHVYTDIDIAPNGDILLYSSSESFGEADSVGIFLSTNDGDSWINRTPGFSYPFTSSRGLVKFAPSNPTIAYAFIHEGGGSSVSFFELNLSNGLSFNRTDNLPNYGGPVGGRHSQGDYNMVLAVHPTDPELVFIGGINLFRTFDGFKSSTQNTINQTWIGGYAASETSINRFSNHHPDQHVLIFDPNQPNRAWSGHDGGVSVTQNIANANVFWSKRDNGYNVTQMYTVAIGPDQDDDRIMGGTQDNGTPYFRIGNEAAEVENDLSSGDGSDAHFGENFVWVSTQFGSVLRLGIQTSTGNPMSPFGTPAFNVNWSFVNPTSASQTRFVHPFAINPTNENVMFYPDGRNIYRNTQMQESDNGEQFTFSQREEDYPGWKRLDDIALPSAQVSALAVSYSNPPNRLYYAGNSDFGPEIFRLDNANIDSTGAVNIQIPNLGGSLYPHDIAINPENGDEVIVVFANYESEGIFYSSDAGATWQGIEGNLLGDENNLGPSIRAAAILPGAGRTIYLIGTSTGVYSTDQLQGANTIWTQEATDLIGFSVVADIDVRVADNVVAIGTHGRGVFVGTPTEVVSTIEEETIQAAPGSFELAQNFPNPFNPATTITYSLNTESSVSLSVFDLNGRRVASILQNQPQSSGNHSVRFDASALASGVYLYRIEAMGSNGVSQIASRKMTLIK